MAEPLKGSKVPIHLMVLTAMHFFGHGSYQTGTGLQHPLAVGQPTVSRCIAEVSDVITRFFLNTWVKCPQTEKKKYMKQGLRLLESRLRSMLGVINCTHIEIIAPPQEDPAHPAGPYDCRKGYYSINTQIIADTNRIIRAINARFPGSVHDSAMILQVAFLLFADDLKLYMKVVKVDDAVKIQSDIDSCWKWCTKNSMIPNMDKYKVISFTRNNEPKYALFGII